MAGKTAPEARMAVAFSYLFPRLAWHLSLQNCAGIIFLRYHGSQGVAWGIFPLFSLASPATRGFIGRDHPSPGKYHRFPCEGGLLRVFFGIGLFFST